MLLAATHKRLLTLFKINGHENIFAPNKSNDFVLHYLFFSLTFLISLILIFSKTNDRLNERETDARACTSIDMCVLFTQDSKRDRHSVLALLDDLHVMGVDIIGTEGWISPSETDVRDVQDTRLFFLDGKATGDFLVIFRGEINCCLLLLRDVFTD